MRTSLYLSKLLIVCFLLVSCESDSVDTKSNNQPVAPDNIASIDYDVYTAAMRPYETPAYIVIAQESERQQYFNLDSEIEEIAQEHVNFDNSTYQNMIANNANSVNFDGNKFRLNPGVSLLSAQEQQEIFSSDNEQQNWDTFYSRYTGAIGYFELSRIGYNHDQTQAIFEYVYGFGYLEWKIVYLELVNNEWVVKHRKVYAAS